ncbi:hypothetical protein P4S64_18910 [Vibrio sp. M60_M31a]
MRFFSLCQQVKLRTGQRKNTVLCCGLVMALDVHQPLTSRLTILPDLAAMDTHDPRSEAEKALAAIQATLSNRATSDQLKLSFGGRSLEKTPLSDLLKLEQRFLNRVTRRSVRSLAEVF